MPRLMEKQDWMKTVANVGAADRVWCENVIGQAGPLSFALPESGMYQVILVKLGGMPKVAEEKTESAHHDMIGGGQRINIGSMKNEILLPECFDQEFEELDGQVGTMFTGVAS